MVNGKFLRLMTWAITVAVGSWVAAQLQTEVPQVVPGANPAAVEHIKIHGTALEGQLGR